MDTIHDASCGIGVVVASGGYEHIYCHLQQQRMRSGQAVQAGQVIGQVGMTGAYQWSTSALGNSIRGAMAGSCAGSQGHDPQSASQWSSRPLTLRVIPDPVAVTLTSASTVVGGLDSNGTETISGAAALMDALRRHGVDTIFGYPGGAILPIYDAPAHR